MLVLIGFAPVGAGLTGVLSPIHTHTHKLTLAFRSHLTFLLCMPLTFSLPPRGSYFQIIHQSVVY